MIVNSSVTVYHHWYCDAQVGNDIPLATSNGVKIFGATWGTLWPSGVGTDRILEWIKH
jgi:hypothetical protein